MRETLRDPLALLPEIAQRIRAVCDPEEIILFGSYARGDNNPGSDLDILVIMDRVESPLAESARIYKELSFLRVPVDIVVVSKWYVRQYHDLKGTIVYPALREGKTIYAR